jgi:hypothetical protein
MSKKPLRLKRPAKGKLHIFATPTPGPSGISKVKLKLKKPAANVITKPEEIDKDLHRRQLAREAYHRRLGQTLESCLGSLDHLEDFCKVQLVTLPNGDVKEWPVCNVSNLAEPLQTSAVSTNRWRQKGMIPAPVLHTSRGDCYHLEEVRSMVRILGEHQKDYRQYRADHTETRDRLFRENARIRSSILKLSQKR